MASTSPSPEVILLRLYVAGGSPRSLNALRNLQRLEGSTLAGRYHLEVVDVLAEPARAEQDKILATPTLMKVAPGPRRRILGDLGDLDTLVRTLAAVDATD